MTPDLHCDSTPTSDAVSSGSTRRASRTGLLVSLLIVAGCGGGGEAEPVRAEAAVPKVVEEKAVAGPAPLIVETGGVEILATLPVGTNPQQIAFSPDGTKAYVAAGRSNQVTVVNALTHVVERGMEAPGIPMGVGVLPSGEVLVSLFKDGRIERFDPVSGSSQGSMDVGAGPSFFAGPLPDGTFLVSSERAKQFQVIDGKSLTVVAAFPMGDRPFPSAVTSDGRFAFVGSYVHGTVAIVDLASKMIVGLVPVGSGVSGGAVLPGDQQVVLAVREENRLAVLDIRSRREVKSLRDGIGEFPLNVTLSPDGRLAFVNSRSGDISVLALPELEVIDRIRVGPIPAAVAVHPSGETLWISCEGDHQLYILEIPDRWLVAPSE